MSEKQSDEHIIPIVVVGECDSATRDKGLSSAGVENNTPEGSPSIADVENNSKKLSVFEKMGQVAAKAVHVIREAYAAERIDVDAKRPENDKGVMERLGFPEKSTDNSDNSGASEGSTDSPKPSAKPKDKESKADTSQGEQASGTNESKTKKSKADTHQVNKNTSDGTKSTSEKQASSAKPKDKESKADTSQGEQASGTNESKTEKSKANTSPEKQAPGAAERFMSELRKSLDKKRQDQESSAAGSSEDKQDKDSNPNTGEAQTKETRTSPEKREAADELEKAKDRHSKASAAAESKNPLGKKRRQAELKAATEQLKKCELLNKAADKLDDSREIYAETSAAFETYLFKGKKRQAELEAAAEQLKQSELGYMGIKFADKIEAAKQDPEKQAELAAEMAQAALASMQETSRTTTDKYDDMLDDRNIFKKAAAKVGKWFNKGGRIAQWLKPGGAGFVAGTATGFFAGYAGYAGFPITTAVGAVTGLGFAGLTKQAVLEERRGEDRIGEARLETIEPSFEKAVANMKIDDVMEHAVNVSVDNLKDVSIERQDALRKKVRSSLGKYGVGFALGGFAGKFVGDWANSAHATGAESNTATPSQSGSEQIPQSSGASSVDNSVDKIVNNINPDTSNFNSYDYPWDWAAEKFGNANAMDQLHNLADKAMANGHTVQWFNNPDGSVWMKVDGSSATADVLKVLNKYA